MTPAMLDRAGRFAAEQGVRNVDWHQGDAYLLPYAAESFTIVVCLAVSGYLSQGPLFMSFALRYGTCSLGRSRMPATRSKSSRRSGRRRLMVASGSPFIFTVTTSMLPIVPRSLSLAHQFDFATVPWLWLLEVRCAANSVIVKLVSMSAFGTRRPCQRRLVMCAFGVKRTYLAQVAMSANDPKRTSTALLRLIELITG